MPDLPILPPTVREGFCNSLTGSDWVQILANEIVGRAVAKFDGSGFTVVINQQALPGPTDRTFLWRQPSTAHRGLYAWDAGTSAWIIPHPSTPSGAERRLWEGVESDSWSYDGGDGTDPAVPANISANTGAMWEVDHNYDGRSPMGPGAISGADPAKSLTLSEMFGGGTLLDAPIFNHVHVFGRMNQNLVNDDYFLVNGSLANANLTGTWVMGADVNNLSNTPQALGTGIFNGITNSGPYLNTGPMVMPNGTTTLQMNIVHPVRGCFMLKRTARVNWVGA